MATSGLITLSSKYTVQPIIVHQLNKQTDILLKGSSDDHFTQVDMIL